MQTIEEGVCDQAVLKLLRAMLRAGVLSDGVVRREVTGAAQGGPVSPLLCNVYLHRLDRAWDVGEHGVLVRFADDAVILCGSRRQAEAALVRFAALLVELGLEPKAAKTRIVHVTDGGEGLDFLGFHHRWVRSQGRTGAQGVAFLARWPSDKAMQHARDRIRQLTDRRRTLLPVETIVEEVNGFLRGWAGYFRYGNSALGFDKIRDYAVRRLMGFVAKKHRRSRAFGRWVVAFASTHQLGLIRLDGTVVAPRPLRAWRGSRMPAVNGVGKPCAREPHARFDGRELETEPRSDHGHGEERPTGNRVITSGSATYRRSRSPRQLSTLRGDLG